MPCTRAANIWQKDRVETAKSANRHTTVVLGRLSSHLLRPSLGRELLDQGVWRLCFRDRPQSSESRRLVSFVPPIERLSPISDTDRADLSLCLAQSFVPGDGVVQVVD